MIVHTDGERLHLITQPDHAALARRVMERWAPLHDVERRSSILLAVEEHDNGWQEPDAAPRVDPATGRVFDFTTIPVDIRQAVWPRGVQRLAGQDEWAAALVAQHALTVYDRYRADPDWARFFATLEAMRDELTAAARRTAEQRAHDYAFVRIGDLISLMFCTRWDEPQVFAGYTFTRDGARVIVMPGAFGGREIPIAVQARAIPSRPYRDDDDLQQTLRTAPALTLSGEIHGAA